MTGRGNAFHSIAAAVLLAVSPSRADEPTPSAYRVSVDLGSAIAKLGDSTASTSDAAVELLASLGPAVLPALDQALAKEPEEVRLGVVEVLDLIAAPECVPLLIRAAADPSLDVRVDAIGALGSFEDERGRVVLEAALDDPALPARRAAAAACAPLCRSEAAQRRLAEMAVREQPLDLLYPARHSLAIFLTDEDPERVRKTREIVDAVARPAFRGSDAEQRARAALVLADFGDAAAIDWMVEHLSEQPQQALRVQMISSLGKTGNEKALPVLDEQAKVPERRPVVCGALDLLAARKVAGAAESAAACRAAMPKRAR